jgi:hypothetical protein
MSTFFVNVRLINSSLIMSKIDRFSFSYEKQPINFYSSYIMIENKFLKLKESLCCIRMEPNPTLREELSRVFRPQISWQPGAFSDSTEIHSLKNIYISIYIHPCPTCYIYIKRYRGGLNLC